jgi:hypothetical protein
MLPLTLLDRVIMDISGNSVFGQLEGGFLMVWYPLKISGDNHLLSLPAVFLTAAMVILLTLLFLRLTGGKDQTRMVGTWDCGFQRLSPRMQYSGTAFSKPVKIVFRLFFKSSRNLKLQGENPYHPESMEYSITTESLFEKYFYVPILIWATDWSRRLKFMIQTGSVHTYLLYIFAVMLILMLYNRIV